MERLNKIILNRQRPLHFENSYSSSLYMIQSNWAVPVPNYNIRFISAINVDFGQAKAATTYLKTHFDRLTDSFCCSENLCQRKQSPGI